jgi:signal transduction histidine kinase
MNSLERRLQIGLLISLLLLTGLVVWGGEMAVRTFTEGFVASRLAYDAESLLGALRFDRPRGKGIGKRSHRVTPVYLLPYSGHYYQTVLEDGEVVRSRSLWDQELRVPETKPGTTRLLRQPGPANQELLVWVGGFRKEGRALTLAVAEDIAPIQQQLRQYQLWFAGAAVGASLLLLVLQHLVVRLTLRRLDDLRENVRQLAQGTTGTLQETVPDEILPLVREFNRLLELLGKRLERSRNALGNLAHAIKGPLNLLLQSIESTNGLDSISKQQCAAQVERIRNLTERELRRARIAGSGTPGKRFYPPNEIPALIETLKQLHRMKKLRIYCTEYPQSTQDVDREDLLELLGNLLDNACKWANARVVFSLESQAEELQIRVEDDGAGVSDEALSRLTERGVRVDETTEGHGLGLAIAKDVVRLYGGTLTFSRSPDLGGLRVEASLPLRSPA